MGFRRQIPQLYFWNISIHKAMAWAWLLHDNLDISPTLHVSVLCEYLEYSIKSCHMCKLAISFCACTTTSNWLFSGAFLVLFTHRIGNNWLFVWQFGCCQHRYEWKDLWCSNTVGCYQHRHERSLVPRPSHLFNVTRRKAGGPGR